MRFCQTTTHRGILGISIQVFQELLQKMLPKKNVLTMTNGTVCKIALRHEPASLVDFAEWFFSAYYIYPAVFSQTFHSPTSCSCLQFFWPLIFSVVTGAVNSKRLKPMRRATGTQERKKYAKSFSLLTVQFHRVSFHIVDQHFYSKKLLLVLKQPLCNVFFSCENVCQKDSFMSKQVKWDQLISNKFFNCLFLLSQRESCISSMVWKFCFEKLIFPSPTFWSIVEWDFFQIRAHPCLSKYSWSGERFVQDLGVFLEVAVQIHLKPWPLQAILLLIDLDHVLLIKLIK